MKTPPNFVQQAANFQLAGSSGEIGTLPLGEKSEQSYSGENRQWVDVIKIGRFVDMNRRPKIMPWAVMLCSQAADDVGREKPQQ